MPVAGSGAVLGRPRQAVTGPGERASESYDFRRPDRFDPHAVRSLEVAHEIFSRRVASAWGSALRGVMRLELTAVDQVTYDDYVRSLPTPDLMAVVSLAPLPGPIILDCSIQLALQLLDRMLGSASTPRSVAARRPTDIESAVLTDLVRLAVPALQETLAPFEAVEGEVLGVEYNPQLVQAAAPGDSVLLFTFLARATQGFAAEGMITVCYPAAVATALVDRIVSLLADDDPSKEIDEEWRAALLARLAEVTVDLQVTLADTAVPATDLAALQVGDVLRLDHRVERPVHGRIDGHEVLTAHLGRRGRRLGVQIIDPPNVLGASPRSLA